MNKKLFLGLSRGDNFGWGICSKYLRKELSKKLDICNIDEAEELKNKIRINGDVFVALSNHEFYPMFTLKGTRNFGYTFFENSLSFTSFKNARNFDVVIGGSSWNKEKLIENGIQNADMLIQGIDPEHFYPSPNNNKKDIFVIFSGGKLELRKGQDIVIKAVKYMQDKYKDVVLINAWYNFWPQTIVNLMKSPHIKFDMKGNTWQDVVNHLLYINGLDLTRVITVGLLDNLKMREVYYKTDVGLFPNRCEGGTNLVLMEYMACGKPVIAAYNSGQKDMLTEKNSIRLNKMSDMNIYDDNSHQLIAEWYDPDFDEVIEKLEYAYFNRETIKIIGNEAGDNLREFTWERAADNLINIIYG